MKKSIIYSKEELLKALSDKLNSLEQNKVIDAYDMAQNAFESLNLDDGANSFEHASRVCKIIIEELKIYDPELIIASLLHDSYRLNCGISEEIIKYNFGSYVALLIENYPDETDIIEKEASDLTFDIGDKLRVPGDDYLIIRLAARLDNFRYMDCDPKYHPIDLIYETSKKYFAIIENSANKSLIYLMNELKKERNKIIG